MFFNKPKAKYNIVNDIDSDVFNLFQVVSNQKNELEKAFYEMPIHSDLLEYWKQNKETEPIKKALRFLYISNFTYLGKGTTLLLAATNGGNDYRKRFYNLLAETQKKIEYVSFGNFDFRKFLKSVNFDGEYEKVETLIYADPPYVNSDDNYSHSFTKTDHADLQKALIETGCKFAISEFDNEFVIETAKTNGLNIIVIGERQNLKNRRTEILITNYQVAPDLFSGCS